MDVALGSFLAELGGLGGPPTTLIVDDLHLVQKNTDVPTVLEALIERAPDTLTFVVASRTRPDLHLGRVAAQGRLVELATDDLRFSHRETDDLFAEGYHLPLDDDLVRLVEERTEGWAASLQLVYSSIRARRPSEVREFIRSLSGAREPLFDYLAEEVLERQSPAMRQVLIQASLLDRIVPTLVVAALGAAPNALGADEVSDCLQSADDLGLMSRSAQASSSRRFHPLLREFLASQLVATTPPETLREMHLRVARAAEATDWPTAAHHYIEAGRSDEAMRVLSNSSIRALGTGSWGPAMELVARMPEIEPPIPVQVIRARSMVALGEINEAIALLETYIHGSHTPTDLPLLWLALANALSFTSRSDELVRCLEQLSETTADSSLLRMLSVAWLDMLAGDNHERASRSLARLATLTEAQALHLYAGTTHHNRAGFLIAQGNFKAALVECEAALASYARVGGDIAYASSTRLYIAQAAFELGALDTVEGELHTALADPHAQLDVFLEAAMIELWSGRAERAQALLSQADRACERSPSEYNTTTSHRLCRAAQQMALGDLDGASSGMCDLPRKSADPNFTGHVAYLRTLLHSLAGQHDRALEHVNCGLSEVLMQGALRWEPTLRLMAAAIRLDSAALTGLLDQEHAVSDAALLRAADVVGSSLHVFDRLPARLEAHARAWPDRWRPILRRVLRTSGRAESFRAAELLSQIGSSADVEPLITWERSHTRRASDRNLGRSLCRRLSPTLLIHDLGRSGFTVGSREVILAQTRRRAAALLMYLVTRPSNTATKDQVIEELWPDLDPVQGTNSLHQTLYFLRRDVDPKYEDGMSADYIVVEADLVYLDPALVHVDSASFMRQATETLSRNSVLRDGPALIRAYAGRFAPEFEYEEWTMSWRNRVHATFLQLAEETGHSQLRAGLARSAASTLGVAVAVDPSAIEIEGMLVAAYARSGYRAAAIQQYSHYADAYRREYGVDPPTFDDVCSNPGTGHV